MQRLLQFVHTETKVMLSNSTKHKPNSKAILEDSFSVLLVNSILSLDDKCEIESLHPLKPNGAVLYGKGKTEMHGKSDIRA